MKKILATTSIPAIYARVIVGAIFLSGGILKFIRADDFGVGRFAKIGFSNAVFWSYFTGTFEIVCGVMVLIGLLTRVAVIPLLIIMVTAFITTKIPIFADKGFWAFAHEYRTDFAMTVLLIFLLVYGGGNRSLDIKIYSSSKSEL